MILIKGWGTRLSEKLVGMGDLVVARVRVGGERGIFYLVGSH